MSKWHTVKVDLDRDELRGLIGLYANDVQAAATARGSFNFPVQSLERAVTRLVGLMAALDELKQLARDGGPIDE